MRLEAQQLGYRLAKDNWLFRNIDLTLEPGQITGLMGPSGAGKSTIARILAGFIQPAEGSAVLKKALQHENRERSSAIGGAVTDKQGWKRRRTDGSIVRKPGGNTVPYPVQLIFQHPEQAVNPKWKLQRIVEEGAKPDQELLSLLGIDPGWLDRYPRELSGGELQRCCLARACLQAEFLIADEMTSMLDAITQAQIWHAVLGIAQQQGMGLLVISHDQPLIRRLCDRVIYPWETANENKKVTVRG